MADPLVLLPGLLCDARLFAAQLPALSAETEVTVADLARDGTIGAMAERVLATAPARFALAGLSMGGYVAFEILRNAPERVARLALLDTQARADTEEALARRRGLMQLAEKGEFKGVSPRLMPFFIHRDRLGDRELTGTVQAMAESVGRDGFLRQQAAIMARPDSRPDLPAIACPTLVLAGREDAVTPPERQHEMATAIPDATLVLLPRCGHLSPLERPEAVARQLLLWLSA
ncbi:MAG TPA: alpha/beta fold hydrolase [Geminicoccaceae bacterium]|nr:alpha/beta fold hydrolase [Geminicoccaceae bacterium]